MTSCSCFGRSYQGSSFGSQPASPEDLDGATDGNESGQTALPRNTKNLLTNEKTTFTGIARTEGMVLASYFKGKFNKRIKHLSFLMAICDASHTTVK